MSPADVASFYGRVPFVIKDEKGKQERYNKYSEQKEAYEKIQDERWEPFLTKYSKHYIKQIMIEETVLK